MIPRYTPDDVGAIWSDGAKLRRWLDIELAVTAVLADDGHVPADDLAALRQTAAQVDFEQLARRADEIEKTTYHDVIAFLSAFEELAGPPSRHVHYGLTSSDVVDTGLALALVEATRLVEAALVGLMAAVRRRAIEHRHTPMVGRTHGVHAEPTTFGLVLAGWLVELGRDLVRVRRAIDGVRVGKLSGAVGTYAHLAPDVEARALERLGLRVETVATQVIPRDRHAELFSTLAIVAATIERMAVNVRHFQRTEVQEAEEPFQKGQKGSSAMPHKRNPILSENLTGLARLVRSWAHAALEDVALWHERDISHSSVERVIAPDATITVVFMLRRMTRLIDGLVVYPDNLQANLDRMRGLVFSQSVLLELSRRGLLRQQAYVIVQRASMRVWQESISLVDALTADDELRAHLGADEIRALFDLGRVLEKTDVVFDRAIAETDAVVGG
jgi:adenylosuccinate lyase